MQTIIDQSKLGHISDDKDNNKLHTKAADNSLRNMNGHMYDQTSEACL